MQVETRWMRRSDTAEAIRIVSSCGQDMDEKRMERLVSKSGVVCVVAEGDEGMVGFIAYDISRVSKIKILLLGVEEGSRRMGVGRSLVDMVTAKLNKRRNKVELSVSEYNLGAQLFLKSMGFRAVSVVPVGEGVSDYRFSYRFDESDS